MTLTRLHHIMEQRPIYTMPFSLLQLITQLFSPPAEKPEPTQDIRPTEQYNFNFVSFLITYMIDIFNPQVTYILG